MGQAMREMLSKSKLNYPTVLWPICNLYAFSSVKCIHRIVDSLNLVYTQLKYLQDLVLLLFS